MAITIIISDARPQYAVAQEMIQRAPDGAVMVLTYRHRWVSPAVALVVGDVAYLSVPTEDGITSLRRAEILAVSVDEEAVHIAVKLGGYLDEDYDNEYPQYFVQ